MDLLLRMKIPTLVRILRRGVVGSVGGTIVLGLITVKCLICFMSLQRKSLTLVESMVPTRRKEARQVALQVARNQIWPAILSAFRQGFQIFWKLSAVFVVSISAILIILSLALGPSAGAVLGEIIALVAFALFLDATIFAADDLLKGAPHQGTWAYYKRAVKRGPGFIGLWIVVVVSVLAVFFALLVIALLSGGLSAAATGIGVAILLFPSIWIATSLSLSPAAYLLGNLPIGQSLRSSRHLVRHHWWSVWMTLVLIGILTGLGARIASLLSSLFHIPSQSLWLLLFQAVAYVILIPLYPVSITVLYRIREGHPDGTLPNPSVIPLKTRA